MRTLSNIFNGIEVGSSIGAGGQSATNLDLEYFAFKIGTIFVRAKLTFAQISKFIGLGTFS